MRLKNIKRVKAKGHTYYYHRPSGVRLPDVNAPDFMAAYAKLEAAKGPARPDGGRGSVADLVAHYRRSAAFNQRAPKTRKDYDRYLDWLHSEYGDLAVSGVDREFVLELKDMFQATPRKADYIISVVRLLLGFAVDFPSRYGLQWNPATKPGRLHRTDGYQPWPDDLLEAFRQHAYRELVDVVEGGLFTGQRESDVVRMTFPHRGPNGISVAQQKTQKTNARIVIPEHPDFTPTLDRLQASKRAVVIFTTQTGRPWKLDHLRHEIAKWCAKLGFKGYSYHGLRKRAGTTLAEAGASSHQIMSILGCTMQTAELYTKAASQITLARSAIALMPRTKRTQSGTDNGKPDGKPDV